VEPGKKYPLIIFYHGAGGRGDNNLGQIVDAGAVSAFAKAGVFSKRGAYLIAAGQVPKGKLWVDVSWSALEHEMPKVSDSMRLMFDAVDAFVADKENQVDPERIYAMGLSMGGYGTWDAIQRRPAFFAAAVPICGGGDKSMGKSLAHLPIWAWHGDKDNVIKASRSTDMIAAIKAAGGSANSRALDTTRGAGAGVRPSSGTGSSVRRSSGRRRPSAPCGFAAYFPGTIFQIAPFFPEGPFPALVRT
jgi:predicted peptidase